MRLILAAALLGAFASPALAQKAGGAIEVGDWKVIDSRNDDGSFKSCVATLTYEDKSMVGFAATKAGETFFLVMEPDAKLTEGKIYPVRFQVDGGKAVLGQGVAADTHMVVVPVENPNKVFTDFAAGNALTLEVADKEYEEPLVGSAAAIKALGACAGRGQAG